MYKKIKNGSFMNWIWFIIAIIPILFIFCDYVNNGNKYTTSEKVDNYIIYRDMTRSDYDDNIYEWVGNNFTVGNNDVPISVAYATTYNQFWLNSNNYNEYKDCFYLTSTNIISEINDLFIYIRMRSINNSNCNYRYYYLEDDTRTYTSDSYISNNEWVLIPINYNRFINRGFMFNIEMINTSDEFSHLFELDIFVYSSEININSSDNLFYKYTNGYYDLLQTIQTNGFISSAFLNLSSLFGVNNVYYSLACYYIEYLLVIVLLHLAFDVLYMLPNICHKFMEKIGGERD